MASDFVSHQARWHDNRISTKSYSVPRHFSWLKNYKLYFYFAVLRVTWINNYGSHNSIKDLAFFEISSQWWSFITTFMTLFPSFFCFALIAGEPWIWIESLTQEYDMKKDEVKNFVKSRINTEIATILKS